MRRRRTIWTAVACITACMLSSCARPALYQPSKTILRTPADAGMTYEDLSLTTQDGVRINAWYLPREGARGTVLFCHGNAGNMSAKIETARVFIALRMNVLLFDYRGYGKSEGEPSEDGTYLDSLAAWDYLTVQRGEDRKRIIIQGRSLGGAVASRLAAEKDPAGVILESAFTSLPDLAKSAARSPMAALACADKYDCIANCSRLLCPALVIHSRQDEVIPYAMGRRLYEIIPASNKEFVDISGRHDTGWLDSLQAYAGGIAAFLDEVLAPKVALAGAA